LKAENQLKFKNYNAPQCQYVYVCTPSSCFVATRQTSS